jgi:hypothetical protein
LTSFGSIGIILLSRILSNIVVTNFWKLSP